MGGKSVNYVRAGDMALGRSEAHYVMLKAAQSHLVSRSHALSARGSGDMGSTSSHWLRAAQGAQSRTEPHRAAQNVLQMWMCEQAYSNICPLLPKPYSSYRPNNIPLSEHQRTRLY